MKTGRIHETDATQRGGIGRTLPVQIIDDNGTTATVRTQDNGLYLKAGTVYTVPSNTVKPPQN